MQKPRDATPLNSESAIFAAAKQEHYEQVGPLVTARDTWRNAAFVAMGVAGIACAGLGWVGSRPPPPPWVIKVDKLGSPPIVARADLMQPVDPDVVAGQLAEWIFNVRSVYPDVAIQRRWLERAYVLMAQSEPGYQALNRWYAENTPWERAKTETVSVEVDGVSPPADGIAWQVDWTETHSSRENGTRTVEHWRAIVSVSVDRAHVGQIDLKNPTNIYIPAFSWRRRDVAGVRS